MDFFITIVLQLLIGLFMVFMWGVNVREIGITRFMVGWVVGIVFIQEIPVMVDFIIRNI